MKALRRICLLPNRQKDPDLRVAREASRLLTDSGAEVFVVSPLSDEDCFSDCRMVPKVPAGLDCLVVIGGDGSILDASETALSERIPLLGVNLGHLGFLAELSPQELPLLTRLTRGEYRISSRMTLSLSLEKEGKVTHCTRYSLNEIAITPKENFGMADLFLTDTDGNRIRYRGDGLIIATPSGSTAYSFSCGGPVIHSELAAICVTPICPHSFFNRAMLLPPDAVVRVTNNAKSGDELMVGIDGRNTYILESGDGIFVGRSDETLQMISFENHGTMNTLRQKMQDAELKE